MNMDVLQVSVMLFLVMDPFGNLPFILGVLKDVNERDYVRIAARELLIALLILSFFLFSGEHIIALMGISSSSLQISGGVILFIIALRTIFYGSEKIFTDSGHEPPFIVPIAVPSIAGPSAIAVIIIAISRSGLSTSESIIGLVIAWSAVSAIILSAKYLKRLLTYRGIVAIERLMGMLLTALAIEMIVDGIKLSLL